jgi:deoxyadenosine/deoxycytidine kinase
MKQTITKEATVTIKLTLGELCTINEMVTTLPDERLPKYVVVLRKQLKDMEERLNEKVREAVNDQSTGTKSFEEQAQVETSKGSCVLCKD